MGRRPYSEDLRVRVVTAVGPVGARGVRRLSVFR